MSANINESSNKGSTSNNAYLFGGDFAKGTFPTLLDSIEAQRVRRFIENLVFRAITKIRTGAPDTNKFEVNFGDPSSVEFLLDIRTALECDPAPQLSQDLKLMGHGIKAMRPGSSGSGPFFYQYGEEGLTIAPEAWPAPVGAV